MSRRGESIYKRKDGRWEGRYKPDGFSGKYKYVYAHTYKEVKEKLTKLKTANLLPNNKKVLISTLCEQWLEFKRGDIKESTYIAEGDGVALPTMNLYILFFKKYTPN